MSERTEFNSLIKPKYRATHTPQCKKCMMFRPWGDDEMVVHHKKMLSHGGTNDDENLVVLCSKCHEEWHSYFDEDSKRNADFDEWVKTPPLWVYSAIGLLKTKSERLNMFNELEDNWDNVKDQRMTEQTSKPEVQEYIKKYSKNWVDW